MTNHTPGPWTYEPQAYHPDRIFAGCKLIATAHGDSAETEADAALIAAAPELLAALEAGYSDLRGRLIQYAQTAFIASYDEAAKHADTAIPVLEQMRAAIAAAKGEQS